MESQYAMKEYMEQYYTHPDEMKGAPRQKHNAMMHKQVSAFDKLVQHSISKFSKDRLYRMLSEFTPSGAELASFSTLRSLVEKDKLRAKKEKRKEESHAVKFFHAFFADIEFLKKIKKHFDLKIVAVLQEFFYAGIVDHVKSQKHGARKRGSPKSKSAAAEVPLEELKKETDVLSRYVEELRHLSAQWQRLLDDDVIAEEAFDSESSFEISMYNNCERFRRLFRFVPDLLMKSFNALELAKKWWIQAEKIHKMLKRTPSPTVPVKTTPPPPKEAPKARGEARKTAKNEPSAKPKAKSTTPPRQSQPSALPPLDPSPSRESPRERGGREQPARKRPEPDLSDVVRDLEVKLRSLIDAINKHEVELKNQQVDLKKLLSREERYEALRSDLERVEEAHSTISRRLGLVGEQKRQLVRRILKLGRSSEQYRETYRRLQETDGDLKRLEQAAEFASFQERLLGSDLDVEMEVRPSMIRFAGEVQEQVRQIEEWLEEEIGEKNSVERELVEIRKKMPRRVKSSSDIGVGTSDLALSDAGTSTEVSFRLNDSSDESENVSEFDPYSPGQAKARAHQRKVAPPDSSSRHSKKADSQSSQTSSGYGGGGDSRSETEDRKRSKPAADKERNGHNQKRSNATNSNSTRSREQQSQSKVLKSKNSPESKLKRNFMR